ncbi:MAG: hypothetical protein P8Y91_08510 [Desulfuromonadales bacterium]
MSLDEGLVWDSGRINDLVTEDDDVILIPSDARDPVTLFHDAIRGDEVDSVSLPDLAESIPAMLMRFETEDCPLPMLFFMIE